MLQDIVLTVIGPDRPGLVQLIADRVAEHGGNWLESRMSHLSGQFAGMVRVQVPAERVAGLRQGLEALAEEGLRLVIAADVGAVAAADGQAASLELVGNDRPGILKAITGVLAAHRVNVEELSSDCVNAPMDGGRLFQARARVVVPSDVPMATVRTELERIATDLMVDVKLLPPAAK